MKNLSATQDVNVVNTATNPVPVTGTVQNAENPARQAVQWSGQLTFTDSGIGHTSITIPAGKIFVVEFASFSGFNSFGGGVSSLTITVTGNLVQGGQGPASYELVIPVSDPPSEAGPPSYFHGGQVVRLYAQPETNLGIDCALRYNGANPQVTFNVSLSGYFVNAQ